MNSNYPNNNSPVQGYPIVPSQYGQYDRRGSSTASQYQLQELQPQSYEHRMSGHEFSNHYGYGPSDDWKSNFELQHPPLPESVTAAHIDIRELQGLSTSANESPWIGAAPNQASRLQTHPEFGFPNTNAPKAFTVAAQPVNGAARRPSVKPRPSFTSLADSGYVSGPPLSEDLPGSANSTFQRTFHFQVDSQNLIPEATPPPESVRSDPHPQDAGEATKRRRSKGKVPPCETCGRVLKNQSDAR